MKIHLIKIKIKVSTHSRPKAAGTVFKIFAFCEHGFNTQPPEGGWATDNQADIMRLGFNTQPPEGGWVLFFVVFWVFTVVSTHSRPKAAGHEISYAQIAI